VDLWRSPCQRGRPVGPGATWWWRLWWPV